MTILRSGARVIHPVILERLARLGHKGRILFTDALFSTATNAADSAPVVHLALTPGVPTVDDVAAALDEAIAIEHLCRMLPESGDKDLPVHQQTDLLLPEARIARSWVPREEFYELTRSREVGLVISTGDMRRFANLLLTVGAPTMP